MSKRTKSTASHGGMHSRSDALVIAFGEDEHRKDFDFVVPVQ